MLRALLNMTRLLGGPATLTLIVCLAGESKAQGVRPPVSEPPLFYNRYVPANAAGGVGAAMYPSPRTNIPPFVGHTYITYQALEPHEYMYRHQRTYFRYNPGGGFTKAKIYWKSPLRVTEVAGAAVSATGQVISSLGCLVPAGL